MNPEVIIRRLRRGEASIYRGVRLDALKDSPEAFVSSYEAALEREEESWILQADSSAEGSDRAAFVVFSDQPVGLAALYRAELGSPTGELLQMWIAPSLRGSGVAGDLLDHLFEWASRNGFSDIRAEVVPGNAVARRFYERYGFRAVDSDDGRILLNKEVESI